MKHYWRALLIQLLCLRCDAHDTFPHRSGTCRRCGLPIDENGDAIR